MSLSKHTEYAFYGCALYAALLLCTPLFAAEDASNTPSSRSALFEDDTSSKNTPVSDAVDEDLSNTEKMTPENDRAAGKKKKDALEGENETKSSSTILKNNPPFEWPPFDDTPPHKN